MNNILVMKNFVFVFMLVAVCTSTMAQQKGINDSVKKATIIKSPVAAAAKAAQPLKAYKAVPYWKKIIDSLKTQEAVINKSKIQFEALNKENANLRNELKISNDSLASLKNIPTSIDKVESNTTSIDKVKSNTRDKTNLILGIAGFLGICLGIIAFLYISAKKEATYRIGLFDDLSKEYQTYKLKSNEKEKKLSRELQTERNRLEELLNNR